MRNKLLTTLLLLISFSSFSQEQKGKDIRVFFDCNLGCDFNFIMTEINYLDFVRDRFTANVYILLTVQETGSGGMSATLYFSGLQNFQGMEDTLKFNTSSVATEDEERRMLVQYLKLGLTRFIAKSSLAESITIRADISKIKKPSQTTTKKKDPWNSWVFNVGSSFSLSGSDNYSDESIRLSFNAGRVTEKLKFNISSNYSNQKSQYIFNDYDDSLGTIIYSDTTNNNLKRSNINGMIAASINNHWSIGAYSSFYTSTFSNIKKSISLKPTIEYSVFNYKTVTTKFIGLLYKIGLVQNEYDALTWRNKKEELLWQQNISLDMNFTQKWGSFSTSIYWSNYFFDSKWNNYGVNTNGDFRIAKGLTLNFYGGLSFIHDQVELPKGNATQTQVLIRQRILKNTFDYYTGIGFNYRFGSIYNNAVNPRLGDGRFF